MGTAYLLCPEARISTYHRAALKSAGDNLSVITNVLTGRPARVFMNRIARELGPLASGVPSFPLPGAALAPLRAKAESQGSAGFSALYAGQAAALGRELPAGELTSKLAAEARERLGMVWRALLEPRGREPLGLLSAERGQHERRGPGGFALWQHMCDMWLLA